MRFLLLADIHDTWIHLRKMTQLASEMEGVVFLGDLMTFGKISTESMTNFARIKDASNWMVGIPGNGPLPKVREFLDELGINLHCKARIFGEIGFFGVGGIQNTVTTINNIREVFKNEDTSSIAPDERAMETLNEFGIFYRNHHFVVEDWSDSQLAKLDVYTSPFEHSEERIYEILASNFKEIENKPITVLISHVPPYEPGIIPAFSIGISTGSKGITRFIEEFHPSISLSGHYHMYHEFSINATKCVTVPAVMNGQYGILKYDPAFNTLEITVHKF